MPLKPGTRINHQELVKTMGALLNLLPYMEEKVSTIFLHLLIWHVISHIKLITLLTNRLK